MTIIIEVRFLCKVQLYPQRVISYNESRLKCYAPLCHCVFINPHTALFLIDKRNSSDPFVFPCISLNIPYLLNTFSHKFVKNFYNINKSIVRYEIESTCVTQVDTFTPTIEKKLDTRTNAPRKRSFNPYFRHFRSTTEGGFHRYTSNPHSHQDRRRHWPLYFLFWVAACSPARENLLLSSSSSLYFRRFAKTVRTRSRSRIFK